MEGKVSKEKTKAKKKSFFSGVKAEFGKIKFLAREEVIRRVILVIVFTAIIALLTVLMDFASINLVNAFINLGEKVKL